MPVCLAICGGPVPVSPTVDGCRERLLGGGVSHLNKTHVFFLLLCSPLIVIHWRLGKFHCL